MSKRKAAREKLYALLMAIVMALLPLGYSVMAYEPEGGIYNPGKSKDILINIDDEMLAGQTEEEFINSLKTALMNLGEDISTINITLLRRELDATNTNDWYIYDHTNGTAAGVAWVPPLTKTWWTTTGKTWEGPSSAPVNTDKATYINYYDSYANSNYTTGYNYATTYNIPDKDRFNATIKSVVDLYGLNGLRLVWGLREHIYAYSTPVPGRNEKYANMIFAGYGTGDYSDYMYYPITENSVGSIEFDIDSAYVNDHSLRGAGLLINTGLSGTYQKGYMLYFDFRDQSGAAEGTNKVSTVKLFVLNNNVTPAMLQSDTSNKILNYFTPIGEPFANFPAGSNSHWHITFSDSQITVTANDVGSNQKTSKTWESLTDTHFYGFGPLVNYSKVGHTCARGTVFQFTNLLMTTKYTDEFLNLKDASFDTGTDVERYFINLTNRVIDDANYINPDIYWDTVNRLKSDEVFYLTNEENSILTDGGIKDPGDHLQNGETFAGLSGADLINELAKYIYNDGADRVFEKNTNQSGGGKPTAVFTLNGKEGTNEPSVLQAVEVQRVIQDKPVQISAYDTSVPGRGNSPITEWTYTVKNPEGEIINTVVLTTPPTENDILLEIGPDSETGKYRVELVVKDDAGVYSDKVTRTFEVKKDTVFPDAVLGPNTLTPNTKGEYDEAPQTIDMSDEGWGVIAYKVEYLHPGTNDPLTGVKTVGDADYTAEEIELNERALSHSIPNNVSGLPGKYDIKVTVYDWAGNETVKIFTVNTLETDANRAAADLSSYLTAAAIKTNDPDLEIIEDLIAKAEKIAAEYVADGGSTGNIANYGYIEDARDALDAYKEAVYFADLYGSVTSITSGGALTVDTMDKILEAIDAYDSLSGGAKSILGDISMALSELGDKVRHMQNVAVVLDDLIDCTDPDNINESTINDALQLLTTAKEKIDEYIAAQSNYSETDLLNLPEYQTYTAAKNIIEQYLAAQDYLSKYDILSYMSLSDIPNGLTGMTIEGLINELENARGSDYENLSSISKYYVKNAKLHIDNLYHKATKYKTAADLLADLKAAINGPIDTYEILIKIMSDPEGTKALFARVVSAIENYSGSPKDDFEDFYVYTSFRDALDNYDKYLDYLNSYANILSLSVDTVQISDISSIENAIFVYEGITDPDVKKALESQKDTLDTLLAKARELLDERRNLKDEIETLIDSVEPYRAAHLINKENQNSIADALEMIRQKIEQFIETGGTQGMLDDYDIYLRVLEAYSEYIILSQNEIDPNGDEPNPNPNEQYNFEQNGNGNLGSAISEQNYYKPGIGSEPVKSNNNQANGLTEQTTPALSSASKPTTEPSQPEKPVNTALEENTPVKEYNPKTTEDTVQNAGLTARTIKENPKTGENTEILNTIFLALVIVLLSGLISIRNRHKKHSGK